MKSKITLKILGMVVCLLIATSALSQTTAFTYQGRLNDGASVANGSYDISFAAYDASTNGNLVGSVVTNTAVVVSNGLFTTSVDFGSGVFTGSDLWLEIAVSTNAADSFSTILPRQQISPTPYALYSQAALYAQTSGTANAVASSTISANQLNTGGGPASGQVLAYNGTQLVWQDPVVGGTTGGWSLNGNSGTTPGLNFLGTTDNKAFELKVGGVRGLRIEPTGSSYPNVIGGGPSNVASNGVIGAVIGGGVNNTAGGQQSFVGGGYQNNAFGYISSIAGGAYNIGSGNEAFVGGGAYNQSAYFAALVGGLQNSATGNYSFIGGGSYNVASGLDSVVCGGGNSSQFLGANTASGDFSSILGGKENTASGPQSSVIGGWANAASGDSSVVAGGYFNTASGNYSFAAGSGARAIHSGTFVWSDPTLGGLSSTTPNQFLIRAGGGVGIGTAQTPPGGLRVASGGLAVTGGSSPNYQGASGVFIEKAAGVGAVFAYDYTASGPLSLALNSPGGKVGVGTLSPQYTLDVNGTTRTHSIIITGGADLAEPFKIGAQEIEKGSVVVIDEDHPGELKLSSSAYDPHVAGIISGANGINPGIALQQEGKLEGGQNVALTGRVYVLADATAGAIKPGDLLTSSSIPGHAMKVTDHGRAQGAIIGKAMSALPEGKGMVLVLVSLQ